jgi:hypothetical protein
MMGLASIIRRDRAVRDNGDSGSLFLGEAFRQAVKDAVKEAVWELILNIPGVGALRWIKNKLTKLKAKR